MEFSLLLVFKVIFTFLFLVLIGIGVRLLDSLILKPERVLSKLRKQGIRGPKPSILVGNTPELRKIVQTVKASHVKPDGEGVTTHNSSYFGYPFLHQWREQYGSTYAFQLGTVPIMHTNHPDILKEITTCTLWSFGKPAYQAKERGALFGNGVLTANGPGWAHQRKVLAPELYMDKIKGMIGLMTECSVTLIDGWNSRIEAGHGVADIKIDDYLRKFSREVISRSCFGSKNFESGEEIFLKLRGLQHALSKKALNVGLPLVGHLPTKVNREIWRLEKEVRALILETTKKTSKEDLLYMIREGARSDGDLTPKEVDNFIVDNCKNIYVAGYETTAVTLSWTLMLLATNPDWQEKARAEFKEVCGDQMPDAEMIRKLKVITTIINESLRLYPPGPMVSREAREDLKFGDIIVPKGCNVWTLMGIIHQDPETWGPDAAKFNPERFANGVKGACKYPFVYMPFGVGPRVCLGQHFAMTELKILLGLIVKNFEFSLSPNYVHDPVLTLIIEPKDGVNLLVRKV